MKARSASLLIGARVHTGRRIWCGTVRVGEMRAATAAAYGTSDADADGAACSVSVLSPADVLADSD
eukprot:6176651-Pleurochrysis_carterae.AAC.1